MSSIYSSLEGILQSDRNFVLLLLKAIVLLDADRDWPCELTVSDSTAADCARLDSFVD